MARLTIFATLLVFCHGWAASPLTTVCARPAAVTSSITMFEARQRHRMIERRQQTPSTVANSKRDQKQKRPREARSVRNADTVRSLRGNVVGVISQYREAEYRVARCKRAASSDHAAKEPVIPDAPVTPPVPPPPPAVHSERRAFKDARKRKGKPKPPESSAFSTALRQQMAAEKEVEERVRRRLAEMREAVRAGKMAPAYAWSDTDELLDFGI